MKNSMTLAFLALSIGLVGTWIYHLYDKTIYSGRKTIVYVKDTVALKRAMRDSLQKVYAATIQDLPIGLDSIRNELESSNEPVKTPEKEIYTINKEISDLLKKSNPPDIDIVHARQKIVELQEKVREYREQNCDMKEEMRRLNDILEKLTSDMKNLEQNMQKVALKN